ncbi:hypothetical protein CVIRNUC_004257 [Coccomyxa viridis]|uniref:Uncharacterized protein n=1 Tax=Coccomyxa viridis TaxID=1274662 RepID=A0AAV1I242_9CHLO|nr:hypothetical protein CVIRNUC_004257 [Coccomyxa viridis]
MPLQVDSVVPVSLCAPPTEAASSAVRPVASVASPRTTVAPAVNQAMDLARAGKADRS